jgi:hypothetical protein
MAFTTSGLSSVTEPLIAAAQLDEVHSSNPQYQAAAGQVFHVKPLAHDVAPSTTTELGLRKASVAGTPAATGEAASRACVDWLVQIIQASPNRRTETKSSLWKKTQEKWPGAVSERSFIAARAQALRTSGARAWSAPGAPRKSPRSNRRAD